MCLPFEVRAFIQFPNANKLLFILPLSLFIFDVADTFSLPAKSTKINFPKATLLINDKFES
jgi:hypothetical protein